MIKVFQLIRSIHLGGAEIVAFNLSEYCNTDNNNFEFVIIELHNLQMNTLLIKRMSLKKRILHMPA